MASKIDCARAHGKRSHEQWNLRQKFDAHFSMINAESRVSLDAARH
jgi:hypothetical protein